jgi:hypothetical protein
MSRTLDYAPPIAGADDFTLRESANEALLTFPMPSTWQTLGPLVAAAAAAATITSLLVVVLAKYWVMRRTYPALPVMPSVYFWALVQLIVMWGFAALTLVQYRRWRYSVTSIFVTPTGVQWARHSSRAVSRHVYPKRDLLDVRLKPRTELILKCATADLYITRRRRFALHWRICTTDRELPQRVAAAFKRVLQLPPHAQPDPHQTRLAGG